MRRERNGEKLLRNGLKDELYEILETGRGILNGSKEELYEILKVRIMDEILLV